MLPIPNPAIKIINPIHVITLTVKLNPTPKEISNPKQEVRVVAKKAELKMTATARATLMLTKITDSHERHGI